MGIKVLVITTEGQSREDGNIYNANYLVIDDPKNAITGDQFDFQEVAKRDGQMTPDEDGVYDYQDDLDEGVIKRWVATMGGTILSTESVILTIDDGSDDY